MATEKLLKDLGDVHARLFDHKPVLRGEINFFLKEFEEKRKNREEIRLQKTLDYNKNMAEKLIPASMESMDQNLSLLVDKLKAANERCDKILKAETDNEKLTWLNEERSRRKQEWAQFMDGQCEKSSAVDKEFEKEVNMVKDYYKDLEDKLQISKDRPSTS